MTWDLDTLARLLAHFIHRFAIGVLYGVALARIRRRRDDRKAGLWR